MTTTVGLFGADLTNFKSDCASSETDYCDVNDFVDFSGWAIGINIAHDDDQQPLSMYDKYRCTYGS